MEDAGELDGDPAWIGEAVWTRDPKSKNGKPENCAPTRNGDLA